MSEPELGLGEVRAVGPRRVTLTFRASVETREYVAANAPLRRAAFRAGDAISTVEHGALTVDAVEESEGLLYYQCGDLRLCETALTDTLSFNSPSKRLFAGQGDPPAVFDLRVSALGHQHERRKSEVRGFLGGRIDLLPHQLSIASEVTGRLIPRVLLSDEVGLGKTIEASLIVHRLLLTGRAQRVCVVVPESLIHQWFLELLRRFSLWFHIFDEGRCTAIEAGSPGVNPFLENQLVLCEIGLFTRHPLRLQQALDAGWDVLVVDEAHHLHWSPAAASPEYSAIEALGRRTPGLLLLTATPEQLGVASHFARLRLLDPDRFHDLEEFSRESDGYRVVARLAEQLRTGAPLTDGDVTTLAGILDESAAAVRSGVANAGNGDRTISDAWIDVLLDQHGTGRVMFRNTRATVGGFPSRVPHLYPLTMAPADTTRAKALAQEWRAETNPAAATTFRPAFARDPRLDWLVDFLRSSGQEKVLLICHTRRKALAIEAALKERTAALKMAAFHEGLTIVQRDRGAAWFAEPDGARLLICSEIGSEGRNFQFAHHLVLFDLPLDPSLLEQRIGRLDRIGQAEHVHVHVPYVSGTHQEILARWYQEGLDAFAQNLLGGRELLERFGAGIGELAGRRSKERGRRALELQPFIDSVREYRTELAVRLEQGRDRLLEWNSFRPETAARLIDEIRRQDEDPALDAFMLSVFDRFFVEVEEVAPRTYRLGSAGVLVDDFPGLPSDGLTVTCDRRRALIREEMQFLTWDHPLVSGALDLLLGSEHGNCAFAQWPDATPALYLEAVYMLECIAPSRFHVDRFLPPTPLRVIVDHRGQSASETVLPTAFAATAGDGRMLLERPEIRDTLLPRLLERTRQLVDVQAAAVVAEASAAMTARLQRETSRLRDLQKVNRTVRNEEIESLLQEREALDGHIGSARLRLDALRVIHRGPRR